MLKQRPALQQSQGRSKPWSGATLINAFAEMADGDKSDQFAIMAIPGLVPFATIGTSPIRAAHRMGQVLYVVTGANLYSVTESGSSTSLGTILGDGPCRIVDNGSELAIHNGATTGYVYSSGAVTTPVNLPAVSDVAYIDGYFVWSVAGGDQFIISGLNAGTTYDPLDVATVEGAPDALVGVINDHRELHFYGTDTVEIWYNSGDADFPFARQGNAFIERGCIDKNSIVKIDNSVHFVGNDRIIYRLNGYDPTRISTHAIEWKLAQATYFRAFTYTQEGHKFYVLNTDAGTFAYDMATGTLHERRSFGRNRYRLSCSETAYGQTILGDAYTGKLYVPSLDVYDEDGETIPVTVELPNIMGDRTRQTLYAYEVYCETGVGNADAPDPQIAMQYSTDGGRLWSNEVWRSLGTVGKYLTRAIWRPKVQFRQLNIRLTMTDPVRRFIMSYWADIR